MPAITLELYKKHIKEERINWFKQPYDLVYDNFVKLGYSQKDFGFFFENASEIVENLRKECWNEFVPTEKEFTSKMLAGLIDNDSINNMDAIEAVTWFVQSFPDHIYALTLSNTQSRRSRAGKEFEAIIELLFTGAGISFTSQGNIGKKTFIDKGLGKLVDVVSPGVTEFLINKRNTILISAKTTLRERWQEVPEEMGRTGAREMFLATLDNNISDEVLNTLYEANIQVVTTKRIRQEKYSHNPRVLDFETLLEIANRTALLWDNFSYSAEQIAQYNDDLLKQADKHEVHEFVAEFFASIVK